MRCLFTDIMDGIEYRGDWNGAVFATDEDQLEIKDMPRKGSMQRDDENCLPHKKCKVEDFCMPVILTDKGVYFKDDKLRFWYETDLLQ